MANGDTREFFDLLFGDLADDEVIEVRQIHPDRKRPALQSFHAKIEEAMAKALHPEPGYGSFVGVAPRKVTGFDLSRPSHNGSGEDVARVPVLWLDIDQYKEGTDKADVIQALRAQLPPTMIVDSGGGLHCYWKLDAAVAPMMARDLMGRLAFRFGGDKACAEPARVLRVPGTVNTKEERPRPVELVGLNAYKVYTKERVIEFVGGLQEVQALTRAGQDVIGQRTKAFLDDGDLPDDGEERTHLLGIARNLCSAGVDEDEAVRLMSEAIPKHACYRCKPDDPWTHADIERLVTSIYKSEPTTELTNFEVVLPTTGRLVPLDIKTWLTQPVMPPDYLIDQWMIQGEVVFMTGSVGIGKTWLSLDASLAVADEEREQWLTFPVAKHGPVLYFDAESSVEMLHERLNMLGANADNIAGRYHVFLHSGLRLDAPDWRKELFALADEVQPAMVVFDSLRRFHTLDENDANEMSSLYDEAFRVLAQRFGAAVLIVDHPSKHGTDGSPRGSSDKLAAADRSWVVKGINGTSVSVEPGKVRRGSRPPKLTVVRNVPPDSPFSMELVVQRELEDVDTDSTPRKAGRPKNVDAREIVKTFIFENDPEAVSQQSISLGTGISRGTVQNILKDLVDDGTVVREKEGYRWGTGV